MARSALPGGGLVEQNLFAIRIAHEFVAAFATYITVHPLEGERCPGVVIKEGWLPLVAVVTICAGGDTGLFKLRTMSIRVAPFTLQRRRLEISVS